MVPGNESAAAEVSADETDEQGMPVPGGKRSAGREPTEEPIERAIEYAVAKPGVAKKSSRRSGAKPLSKGQASDLTGTKEFPAAPNLDKKGLGTSHVKRMTSFYVDKLKDRPSKPMSEGLKETIDGAVSSMQEILGNGFDSYEKSGNAEEVKSVFIAARDIHTKAKTAVKNMDKAARQSVAKMGEIVEENMSAVEALIQSDLQRPGVAEEDITAESQAAIRQRGAGGAALQDAAEKLREFEDFREERYSDNKGEAIGYGHNVTLNRNTFKDGTPIPDKVTKQQAERLLQEDLDEAQGAAKRVTGDALWQKLSSKRQSVLIQMAYQAGEKGLREFKKMLAALGREDFEEAAQQIADSKMGRKQTPRRARALMKAMKEG